MSKINHSKTNIHLSGGLGLILCGLDKNSRVLIYGGDFDHTAEFLSHYTNHLFIAGPSSKTDQPNVSFIPLQSVSPLPLAKHSLDLIFINDFNLIANNPHHILSNLGQLLKSTGQLAFAADNKYSINYLLQSFNKYKKDTNSPSLDPSYSTPSNQTSNSKLSYWGYRKLLHRTGFTHPAFSILLPNCTLSQRLLPAARIHRQSLSSKKKTKRFHAQRFFIKSGLIKYFAPSYFIHSNPTASSFLSQIIQARQKDSIDNLTYLLNQPYKAVILAETNNFIYKIPTTLFSSQRLKQEGDSLAQQGALAKFLPRLEYLNFGKMHIQISHKEQVAPGADSFLADMDEFFKIKNKTIINKRIDQIYPLTNIKKYLEHIQQPQLFNQLIKFLGHQVLPCVPTHGDLHSKNIIHTQAGLKVIDWEFYTPLAPLPIDYLNLILYEETFISKKTYYDIYRQILTGNFRISAGNIFKHYLPHIKQLSPQLLVLYSLQHYDHALKRYGHASFVPPNQDIKLKRMMKLLADYISTPYD